MTGYLALTNGSPQWVAALHVHRMLGFGIVALLFWKGRNILARLLVRRLWRRNWMAYSFSLLMLALLLASLGLGIAWSHAGPFYLGGISGVSWHIYLSLALTPVLVWHTVRHRWNFRTRFWADRRMALKLGGLSIAGLALWQTGELLNRVGDLPGAQRRFTGSYLSGAQAGNGFPATSWLNDAPELLDPAEWRLHVTGLVEQPLRLSLPDLVGANSEFKTVRATLDCTGGWHTTQDWTGIRLQYVLDLAGVRTPSSQHNRAVVNGVFPAVLPGRGRAVHPGNPCRRGTPVSLAWLSAEAGSARQARVRMGKVGGQHRSQRYQQVVAAAAAGDVRRFKHG